MRCVAAFYGVGGFKCEQRSLASVGMTKFGSSGQVAGRFILAPLPGVKLF